MAEKFDSVIAEKFELDKAGIRAESAEMPGVLPAIGWAYTEVDVLD